MIELDFRPKDQAELLASHLAILREEGLFESWDAAELRIGLGELVINNYLSLDELTTIISES